MICELTLLLLSGGFVLEKALEVKLLHGILKSQREMVTEVKKNGIRNNQVDKTASA